jgi:excisionase family DNA binding protein
MFGVSLGTVANWVDSGRLPAHRTPGGHRRIGSVDLRQFANGLEHGLPDTLLPTAGRALRVLVVDDEPDFLLLVRETLSDCEGIEVATANSGFLAGLEIGRLMPDLVLLDLMMPDIDGFEVFRMLKEREELSDIPVVACTAFADRNIQQRVEEAGFTGFLPKPLVFVDLENTLLGFLESNKAALLTKG